MHRDLTDRLLASVDAQRRRAEDAERERDHGMAVMGHLVDALERQRNSAIAARDEARAALAAERERCARIVEAMAEREERAIARAVARSTKRACAWARDCLEDVAREIREVRGG